MMETLGATVVLHDLTTLVQWCFVNKLLGINKSWNYLLH